MKKEALKLADELDEASKLESDLNRPENEADFQKASAMIRRLVEELDKQGELVVYWDGKHFASKEKSSLADIPLYTTLQTKPLSDEEIWKLHDKHIDWIPRGHSEKVIGFVEFARAIEEMHGIK